MAGPSTELRKLIERAETWPKAAQDDLLRAGLEIESGQAEAYRATPEELEAIDHADRAPVATADEVDKVFAKFRRA